MSSGSTCQHRSTCQQIRIDQSLTIAAKDLYASAAMVRCRWRVSHSAVRGDHHESSSTAGRRGDKTGWAVCHVSHTWQSVVTQDQRWLSAAASRGRPTNVSPCDQNGICEQVCWQAEYQWPLNRSSRSSMHSMASVQ